MTHQQVSHRQNTNASTFQWHLFNLPSLPRLYVPVTRFTTTMYFKTQHIQMLGWPSSGHNS